MGNGPSFSDYGRLSPRRPPWFSTKTHLTIDLLGQRQGANSEAELSILRTDPFPDVGAGRRVRHPARVFCGHPEMREAIREFEMGRHHADDREEASAQFDGPANHTRVAMEK